MSSFGGQWRVIRHYLSLSNLNSEVDKLVQRIKPATPEQWDNLIKMFEKAISIRLSREAKEVEHKPSAARPDTALPGTAPLGTAPPGTSQASTVTETDTDKATESRVDKPADKSSPGGLNMGSDAKDLTIEGLWQGLKLKKDLHFGKISEQSWKSNKPIVNKTSIHSRTAYVISAIVSAESAACLAKRAEDFIDHIKQYPEARDYAIKEGAVRALLRVQHGLRGDEPRAAHVSGIVKEALALMGHTGPTRGPGPNILSLDGGGIRGLIAIEILRHLERLTGRRVNDLFDYIIGVSTGAIIAAVIGSGVGTLETAGNMYRTLSKEMFGNTSLIGGTSRLVWTHSYYDTAVWEKMLRDNLGDMTLTECNRHDNPKMALVSCVVNSGSRLSPFLFRTYSVGFRTRGAHAGTQAALVWHAVRASAAAPTYFEEFKHGGLVHQDGGIMVNNPTGVGLHEAKLLFGADALKRATIVSVGTGQTLAKTAASEQRGGDDARGTSWRDKFNKILDSATDTEGVHLLLNDLLPAGSYYRFNPPLMEQCAMDEIDPAKLQSIITDTQAYIRRNQHKFEQAAAMLTRRRSIAQRLADFAQHRAVLMGVTAAR